MYSRKCVSPKVSRRGPGTLTWVGAYFNEYSIMKIKKCLFALVDSVLNLVFLLFFQAYYWSYHSYL